MHARHRAPDDRLARSPASHRRRLDSTSPHRLTSPSAMPSVRSRTAVAVMARALSEHTREARLGEVARPSLPDQTRRRQRRLRALRITAQPRPRRPATCSTSAEPTAGHAQCASSSRDAATRHSLRIASCARSALATRPPNTAHKLRGGGPGSQPAGPRSGTLRWGSGCRCEPRQLHALVRRPLYARLLRAACSTCSLSVSCRPLASTVRFVPVAAVRADTRSPLPCGREFRERGRPSLANRSATLAHASPQLAGAVLRESSAPLADRMLASGDASLAPVAHRSSHDQLSPATAIALLRLLIVRAERGISRSVCSLHFSCFLARRRAPVVGPANTAHKLRGGGPGSQPAGPRSGTLRWGSGCRCEPRQLHALVRPPRYPTGPPSAPRPTACTLDRARASRMRRTDSGLVRRARPASGLASAHQLTPAGRPCS